MKKNSTSYREGLLKDLRHPREAAAYLNAALQDGSQEAFLVALRDVAEANGMARLARGTRLNRENLYRMLSRRGNPQFSSLGALLDRIGLKLAVEVRRPIPA
jgi:probable addiction module antidote protein